MRVFAALRAEVTPCSLDFLALFSQPPSHCHGFSCRGSAPARVFVSVGNAVIPSFKRMVFASRIRQHSLGRSH